MRDIIRFIKRLFGKYESGYEYWVYTKDIKVPLNYRKSRIRKKKWSHKLWHYLKTGEFESKIILDKNFNLMDGYSSVLIAEKKGIYKVPVYFVD